MKMLITGASGLIGRRLAAAMLEKSWEVVGLDRKIPSNRVDGVNYQIGDVTKDPLDPNLVEGYDAIIHLAGESILSRWSETKKRRIYDSRVNGTHNLVAALAKVHYKPSVLISASAIGFYGDTGDAEVYETSAAGSDFFAKVCADWEAKATEAETIGIRTIIARNAIVLGKGGMLKVLLPYFRVGLGVWMGRGKQWFSWVHIDDLVSIYLAAIEDHSIDGPINVVGGINRQKDFMKTIGKVLHRPVLIGTPIALLELRYGGLAKEIAKSHNVKVSKMPVGATITYTDAHAALNNILKNK